MFKMFVYFGCALIVFCGLVLSNAQKSQMTKDYRCKTLNKADKRLCKRIMNNMMLKESQKALRKMNISDQLEAILQAQKPPSYDCPALITSDGIESIGERSLAPYEDYISYKKNRIPRYIQQKRCLCRFCRMWSNGHYQETSLYSSAPIKIEIDVLRRIRNTKQLKKVKEDIVVGCTCVIEL